jgi:hypothetical protein
MTVLNKLRQSVSNPFTYVLILGILAANQGLYYDCFTKTTEVIKVRHDYAAYKEALAKSYEDTFAVMDKFLSENKRSGSNIQSLEDRNMTNSGADK